jgi:hypothetical protein
MANSQPQHPGSSPGWVQPLMVNLGVAVVAAAISWHSGSAVNSSKEAAEEKEARVRIEEKLNHCIATINSFSNSINGRIADHEARIRLLERDAGR